MGAPFGNRNAAGPHKRGKSAKSKLAALRAKIEKHKNMGPRTKSDWRKANARILKTTMYK